MNIVFAGTPEFAAVALEALAGTNHYISLVLTQPDRPAGRGLALQASPVKRLAEQLGIAVYQPLSLKDPEAQARIEAERPDVMVVAAYGLILPQAVLDLPRFGCINIHASLLPRWRGAAPIQRAIAAGDDETGICIMKMEAGLDTGPVLARASLPIGSRDTAAVVHDRLADLGAYLTVATLEGLPRMPASAQPEEGVTYAAKITKADAVIDWRRSAAELDCQIRAFNPFPGAQATLDGAVVKIWQATLEAGVSGEPGMVIAADRQGVVVGCGSGALRLLEVQKAGGKRLAIAQFLAGNPLQIGTCFALQS